VIEARATIGDAVVMSNPVTIRNSPPEIGKVKMMPETYKPGDALSVDVTAADPDGEPVSILYAWSKNGAPAGTAERVSFALQRGDKITVSMTPFDGEDQGKSVFLEREIINIPPVILDHREFSFDGTTYSYQAKASDPDGDTLTYSLDSASNGMTIDSANGLLTWIVPPEFKGKKNVSIIVSDGHGGTAHYNLGITIR
jgi:hypothetical protein